MKPTNLKSREKWRARNHGTASIITLSVVL